MRTICSAPSPCSPPSWAKVTAERDALLAERHGVTPATVAEDLKAALAELAGNKSALSKALGYASHAGLREPLEKGDQMSMAAAMACHKRLTAWRAAQS